MGRIIMKILWIGDIWVSLLDLLRITRERSGEQCVRGGSTHIGVPSWWTGTVRRIVNPANLLPWINPNHLVYLSTFHPLILVLIYKKKKKLAPKMFGVMSSISAVSSPVKEAKHIKHMNQRCLVVRNQNKTYPYIYLHLQVICLNLCVSGFISY